MAALKKAIEELHEATRTCKQKQADAKVECKKLEQDMDDFKHNKEGKITELKAKISKQKGELQKQSVVVKTHQKELQTATLELGELLFLWMGFSGKKQGLILGVVEQLEKDIEASRRGLLDARAGVEKTRKELVKLSKEVDAIEVSKLSVWGNKWIFTLFIETA